MICYRDMTFCSRRDCGNVICRLHPATIDQEALDRSELEVAYGDRSTSDCGFTTRCQVCGSILGDTCRCHQEENAMSWPQEIQECPGRHPHVPESGKWALAMFAVGVIAMFMGAWFGTQVVMASPNPCPTSVEAKYPPPIVAAERMHVDSCVGPYPGVANGAKISVYQCKGDVMILMPDEIVEEASL